jgi:signal transduction histidine kinase
MENAKTEPLSQVVDRVTSLLASQMRKKNITISVSGWEEGKAFFVAGEKLSQVFFNLILNAIDATPPKGEIKIETRKHASGYTFTVTDNGPGIPEAVKDKIFVPFYSTKDGGTGLGLSISKKIVESYGGSLTLSDAETGGACFTVFLPEKISATEVQKQTESDFKKIETTL